MNLLHTLKIVQHPYREITGFIKLVRLNFNLKEIVSKDGNVLSKEYLAFIIIAVYSFVFTILD